jgi:cobalt-zinc-cadmium efflux system outer membrane protein
MMIIRTTLMLVSVLLLVQPAGAQNQILTVRDAIDLATRSNPELAMARTEVDRALAARWKALGSTGLEVMHAREGVPDGGNGFAEQKWAAGLTLPFPLQSMASWQAASDEAAARKWTTDATLLDLTASVKVAYTRLLFAQELVHLTSQEVDLASTLVDVVTARVEVGEAAEIDLMKVELEQTSAQNALRDAELLFQNSRYALFQVLGVDPEEQRYEIVFPDTLSYQAYDIDQEEVMDALAAHPTSRAADDQVSAAQKAVKASSYGLLPDLYAGWFQQDLGTGYQFHGFEAGLRIGLPGADARRANRGIAKADLNDRIQQAFRTELDLKKAAESAWHGFETSRMAVRTFADAQNERAQELLQRTREGYQLGQLDLLTVLDAQRVYLDVQRTYYQQLQAYYLSLIQLERLLGRELVFTHSDDGSR